MKHNNLTYCLLERERLGGRSHLKKFNKLLENKTAFSKNVQLTYHLPQTARSTFVITFSPDRTKIATSHGNHTVKISDCYTCKVIHTLVGHLRTPWCVSFHPRINSILASGCLGGEVRLWNLNNLYAENLIYSSQSVIASLTFHPVDDILVIGTANKIVFLNWNQRQVLNILYTGHSTETIRLVRFLPYGDKLMTGIANASTQYCKKAFKRDHLKETFIRGNTPTSLNVSTRGDPYSGQPVVQTVSYMRMHKRPPHHDQVESSSNSPSPPAKKNKPIQNSTRKLDSESSIHNTSASDSQHTSSCMGKNESSPETKNFSSTKDTSQKHIENTPAKSYVANNKANLGTHQRQFSFQEPSDSDQNKSCSSAHSTETINTESETINTKSENMQTDIASNVLVNDNDNSTQVERVETSNRQRLSQAHLRLSSSAFASSSSSSSSSSLSSEENPDERDRQVLAPQNDQLNNDLVRSHPVTASEQVRSEIWNFTLGDVVSAQQISTANVFDDIDVSVEGASSTIPVHGYVTFPSSGLGGHSASISNLSRLQAQTAVATATARSSHHVHTAVVIASQEDETSEVALQTAVNRAIAGAFAGSGEGAVANNIIDTTHRLQLWHSTSKDFPDVMDEEENVVVPFCKIHNDSSVDISLDGTLVAVFVPSEHGFPMDAQLQVISLRPESYLHCIYSRKYGPNAVSVSLSPLNGYVMVGLASRKLHWQLTAKQLVAQVLQLPSDSKEVHEDAAKAVSTILHRCSLNQRSNVSVNTVRFHPTAGMGILYGTNRGHIQHCHIGPDLDLDDKRLIHMPKE